MKFGRALLLWKILAFAIIHPANSVFAASKSSDARSSKAASYGAIQSYKDCRDLEKWLKSQPARFFGFDHGTIDLSKAKLGFRAGKLSLDSDSVIAPKMNNGPGGAGGGGEPREDARRSPYKSPYRLPKNFISTNNQIQNVDESDIVKSDGNFLYQIENDTLHVVRVRPANRLKEVASVKFSSRLHAITLLPSKKLLVYSYKDQEHFSPKIVRGESSKAARSTFGLWKTNVTILDVSNPEAITVKDELVVNGNFSTARLLPDQSVIVLSKGEPDASMRIDASEFKSWLKSWTIEDFFSKDSKQAIDGCRNIYTSNVDSTRIVILSRILPKDGRVSESIYFGDYTHFVTSENALYFAESKWKQKSPSESILSTDLVQWNVPKRGALAPVATGSLDGSLLNDFSMDVHNGYLRVALSRHYDGGTKNNVVVMETRNRLLKEIGRSSDLASGEEIMAARFVGDAGFIVTFRTEDPLFVLDLSKPSKPTLSGSLNVPGYATYIHPIDAGTLLTAGFETDGNTEQKTGFKISLFDVRNRSKPKLINSVSTKMSKASQAALSHRAFTFSPQRKTLLLPWDMESYADDSVKKDRKAVRHKLSAFKVESQGIKPTGEMTMSGNGNRYEILRSMIVETLVLAISETEVRAADLGQLPKILKTVSYGPTYKSD